MSPEDKNLEETVSVSSRFARKIFGTCLMLVVFDKLGDLIQAVEVEIDSERKCKSAVICRNNRNCLRVTKRYTPRVEMTNLVLKKECLFSHMFLSTASDLCTTYDDWFGECCSS